MTPAIGPVVECWLQDRGEHQELPPKETKDIFDSEFGEFVELLQHETRVNDLSRTSLAAEAEEERLIEESAKGPIDCINGPGDVGGRKSLEEVIAEERAMLIRAAAYREQCYVKPDLYPDSTE